LSHRVLELAYEHMNEPEKLVVESEFITNASVRQLMYFPSDEEKLPLLIGLLSRSEGARTMVFVNTKAFVERVARALERAGYRVGVLSGDVPQKKRESLLKKFQAGQLELLVATDVAARGLHIDGVSHVYNYDLPFDAEDYVHRIGRTARLGAEGDAISFACERYAMSLPDIESYIEQKLPVGVVDAEVMTSIPRTPRVVPEGSDVEDEAEESVSAIFKEAREQRAADDARRGVKPGSRDGASRGPRTGSRDGARPPRSGSGDRPAGARSGEPRAPRPRAETVATDALASTTLAASDGLVATGAVPTAGPEFDSTERKPRKRRRRRGGARVEGDAIAIGAEAATAVAPGKPVGAASTTPATPVSAARATATPEATRPGLLGRIGRKLRSLVTRAPRSNH